MNEIKVGNVAVVDLSNCKTAEEAVEMLIASPNPCLIVDNGDFARAMEEPEHTPRFAIGDVVRVRVRESLLEYMGVVGKSRAMVVTGVKKLPHCEFDCFAYDCSHGREECCFLGNELELVKGVARHD